VVPPAARGGKQGAPARGSGPRAAGRGGSPAGPRHEDGEGGAVGEESEAARGNRGGERGGGGWIRKRGGRRVGPTVVCWFGVGDIGEDGCGKTDVVLRNLDDQTEYSVLGYANGVRRVLPASETKTDAEREPRRLHTRELFLGPW
jgi:hypothetical protein